MFQKRIKRLDNGLEVRKTDRYAALLNLDWSTELAQKTCPVDLRSTSFLCIKSVGCYFPPALKTPQSWSTQKNCLPRLAEISQLKPHFKGILCFMNNVLRVFPILMVHIVCHTAYMEKTYFFLLLKHYSNLLKFETPKYFKRSYEKGTIRVCM